MLKEKILISTKRKTDFVRETSISFLVKRKMFFVPIRKIPQRFGDPSAIKRAFGATHADLSHVMLWSDVFAVPRDRNPSRASFDRNLSVYIIMFRIF